MLRRLLQRLRLVARAAPLQKPWTVDRDGRVKTDKHRPVILRARAN
jgi:hypothetical protein